MKLPGQRTVFMLALCALATLCICLLHGYSFDPLERQERYFQDLRTRRGEKTPPDPRLVFIGLTRPAYDDVPLAQDIAAQQSPVLQKLRGRFPWPRSVWAELIERLAQAGAKVIALDILFAAQTEDDDAFARVLDKYKDRVVIVSSFRDFDDERGEKTSMDIVPPASLLPTPADGWIPGDPRLGYDKLWPEPDGVVRRARFRLAESTWLNSSRREPVKLPHERYYLSLAGRILEKAGLASVIPAGETPQFIRFTAPPEGVYLPHPINEIFLPDMWSGKYQDGKFFRDKIVLVGAGTSQFQDKHPTPFHGAEMLGPEIHLNILGAALQGQFLQETSLRMDQWILALVGMGGAFVCVSLRPPVKRLLLFGVIGFLWTVMAQLYFDRAGWVIPEAGPLWVLGICGVLSLMYDFFLEKVARLRLLTTMGYYFSPKVLKSVLANPGSMEPREANVTLLLTDLRNSTPLAELLGPKGMFSLLNKVFEAQTTAIMDEEGNLEHFLGDQFLSYWGAPQEQPDAADRTWRAALKLIDAMDALQASLPPDVRRLFGYGVALHCGPVLVGNKGSAKRLDFGLVGDTVNAAARIEALTKYYGLKFLVSGEFLAQLKLPVVKRKVDVVIVKGKSQAVELFEAAPATDESKRQALFTGYEAAFARYVAGEFAPAALDFELLAHDHADPASRVLAERCRLLAAEPLQNWKGVWEMDRK